MFYVLYVLHIIKIIIISLLCIKEKNYFSLPSCKPTAILTVLPTLWGCCIFLFLTLPTVLKIAKEEEKFSNHKKLNKHLPVTILQHKLYNHLVFNDSDSVPLRRAGDHHPHLEVSLVDYLENFQS